jgi:hypothetical protein
MPMSFIVACNLSLSFLSSSSSSVSNFLAPLVTDAAPGVRVSGFRLGVGSGVLPNIENRLQSTDKDLLCALVDDDEDDAATLDAIVPTEPPADAEEERDVVGGGDWTPDDSAGFEAERPTMTDCGLGLLPPDAVPAFGGGGDLLGEVVVPGAASAGLGDLS